MAAPAFGFSVGDFIAVTSLIVSVVQAIRGISDDLIELKELQDELNHLQSLFEQIGRGISSSSDILKMQQILGDFKNFIEKYASSFTGLAKYRRRVEWSLRKKQQVEPFRRRLQSYVSALSMIQGELSRQEIQELNNQMVERTSNLSALFHQETEEIKLHLSTTLSEPLDQKPIYFQDAIGRRYTVPLEVVGDFDDFVSLLKFAFRKHPISEFVEQRELWLFIPASKTENWWYLINESDWARILRPGLRLEMSINSPRQATSLYDSVSGGNRKSAFHDLEGFDKLAVASANRSQDSLVRFGKPMPPWEKLPAELEFRWLSKPAPYGPVSTKPRHGIDNVFNSAIDENKEHESAEFFLDVEVSGGESQDKPP
ncbi:hypothetical protein V8E54_010630 [Elaphomyces granulatus]